MTHKDNFYYSLEQQIERLEVIRDAILDIHNKQRLDEEDRLITRDLNKYHSNNKFYWGVVGGVLLMLNVTIIGLQEEKDNL